MPIDISVKSTPKTDWKSINRLQTVRQVTAADAKNLKLYSCFVIRYPCAAEEDLYKRTTE